MSDHLRPKYEPLSLHIVSFGPSWICDRLPSPIQSASTTLCPMSSSPSVLQSSCICLPYVEGGPSTPDAVSKGRACVWLCACATAKAAVRACKKMQNENNTCAMIRSTWTQSAKAGWPTFLFLTFLFSFSGPQLRPLSFELLIVFLSRLSSFPALLHHLPLPSCVLKSANLGTRLQHGRFVPVVPLFSLPRSSNLLVFFHSC